MCDQLGWLQITNREQSCRVAILVSVIIVMSSYGMSRWWFSIRRVVATNHGCWLHQTEILVSLLHKAHILYFQHLIILLLLS